MPVSERITLWDRFNDVLSSVLANPASWNNREKLRTLCDSLPVTPAVKLLEENQVSFSVIDKIPESSGAGKILRAIGIKGSNSYEKDLLFTKSSCIVIRGGTFEGKDMFRNAGKVVIIDGMFNGEDIFAETQDIVILGGAFRGNNAFRNAENCVILGGNYTGRYAMANAKRIKIYNGLFTGTGAFSHSVQAEVNEGTFSGENAFERAVQTTVNGGKFRAKSAFHQSKSPRILKGQFFEGEAFNESHDAQATGGEFHGDNAFRQAVNLKIWGGRWFFGDGHPQNAFQHALNPTVCISTPLESVDSPVNGIFAAKFINRITNTRKGISPKAAVFYVTQPKGKHDEAFHTQIRRISEEKLATYSDQALFDRSQLLRITDLCYKKG